MPQSDDGDSDDGALPPPRSNAKRPSSQKPSSSLAQPIEASASVSRPTPRPMALPEPELKEPPAKEESVSTMSNEFSSNEEKGAQAGQQSVAALQREIAKLKHENASLRRSLGSGAGASSSGVVSLELNENVMARLEQNHRILRYLHEWADERLPDA